MKKKMKGCAQTSEKCCSSRFWTGGKKAWLDLVLKLDLVLGLALGLGISLAACRSESSLPIASVDEGVGNPQGMNLAKARSESTQHPTNDSKLAGTEITNKGTPSELNRPSSQSTGKSDRPETNAESSLKSDEIAKHKNSASKEIRPNSGSNSDNEPKFVGSKSEYRVLLLGDSLAATGFGVILEKRLDVHPQIRCVRKAKSASGLARPDFFDWISESKRQVHLQKPDLVVVIIGGNDGQDLVEKRGKNRRVGWKNQDWEENYQLRVEELLQPAVDSGARVLWLGLPRTDTKNFEAKLEIIRQAQRNVIDKMGDMAIYLDTTPLLSKADGSPLKTIKDGKRTRKLRVDDGIHFTMAGSQYFADKVYPEVVDMLGLEL